MNNYKIFYFLNHLSEKLLIFLVASPKTTSVFRQSSSLLQMNIKLFIGLEAQVYRLKAQVVRLAFSRFRQCPLIIYTLTLWCFIESKHEALRSVKRSMVCLYLHRVVHIFMQMAYVANSQKMWEETADRQYVNIEWPPG